VEHLAAALRQTTHTRDLATFSQADGPETDDPWQHCGAITAFSGQLARFVIGGVFLAALGVLLDLAYVSIPVGFCLSIWPLGTLLSGLWRRRVKEVPDEMSTDIQRLAEIDRMIHEPARLMVVALLAPVPYVKFSCDCVVFLGNAEGQA
jgi:hypothetical protein